MAAGLQQKLQVKLAHKLILTPSLQQAIKLLPMTTLELLDLLNQEVVENPLLEEVSAEELQQTDEAAKVDKADPEPAPTTEKQDTWDDADYEYFFGEYLDDGYKPRAPQEVKELPPIENTLSTANSLADHLMWQLSLQTDDNLLREIGAAIIGNVDEDGFLVASLEEIAAMGEWPEAEVERVLSLVQKFDPVGVAARNLQECLLLQIRHLGMGLGRVVAVLVEHAPVDRADTQLRKPLLVEHRHILVLDFGDVDVGNDVLRWRRVVPTPRFRVQMPDDLDVMLELVDRHPEPARQLRHLVVLKELEMIADDTLARRALRTYVKEKFRSALWLIKSVDQRQKTIHKVATSIINFQRDFLDQGIEHLRPLVLRDVANDIGMHESTVSRVVNNKYMHTPQGVFEMKYFFHSGIHSSYGESVSSVTIKQRIRKIIENEDSKRPLSDSRIVGMLQDEGLILARRTIAKYREECRIPTSSRRKVAY